MLCFFISRIAKGRYYFTIPISLLAYEAAICALCSILSASCTRFAVWMPKKMYRISVNYVRALYPH